MKKYFLFYFFLAEIIFISVVVIAADVIPAPTSRSISDVLQNARRRDKVLIEGEIQKPFNFDVFLLSDGKSEMAVSFIGVWQDIQIHDHIILYGIFEGRHEYTNTYGLLEVREWSRLNDPKAGELRNKYGIKIATASLTENIPSPTQPTSTRSVESRLKELDDLKAKKLISETEYKEHRKIILDGL